MNLEGWDQDADADIIAVDLQREASAHLSSCLMSSGGKRKGCAGRPATSLGLPVARNVRQQQLTKAIAISSKEGSREECRRIPNENVDADRSPF